MNLAESLSFKAWDSRGKARADASLPGCVAGPWPCVPHSPLWAPGLIACLPRPCRVHVPLPGLCPAACGSEQDTGVCSLRSPSWQGRRKIMLKLPLFFSFLFFSFGKVAVGRRWCSIAGQQRSCSRAQTLEALAEVWPGHVREGLWEPGLRCGGWCQRVPPFRKTNWGLIPILFTRYGSPAPQTSRP